MDIPIWIIRVRIQITAHYYIRFRRSRNIHDWQSDHWNEGKNINIWTQRGKKWRNETTHNKSHILSAVCGISKWIGRDNFHMQQQKMRRACDKFNSNRVLSHCRKKSRDFESIRNTYSCALSLLVFTSLPRCWDVAEPMNTLRMCANWINGRPNWTRPTKESQHKCSQIAI